MNRFLDRPLQYKIVSICVFSNVIIFVVNIFLLLGINSMSTEMEMVYQDNRHLNRLSDALNDVQDSMTEYLRSKTSDSLKTYFSSAGVFSDLTKELDDRVTDLSFGRMERNIKNMSQNYLNEVSLTIEAKRGRNVEKYRAYYESTTDLYNYISEYITSLNLELFVSNSAHYSELTEMFRTYEFVSFIVITIVMGGNIIIITNLVSTIIQPLKKLADSANEVAEGNFDAELLQLMVDEPHIEASSLATISCPACVLVGEHDCITRDQTEAIAAAIPGARLVTVPDMGHSLPRKAPDSVAAQVLVNIILAGH